VRTTARASLRRARSLRRRCAARAAPSSGDSCGVRTRADWAAARIGRGRQAQRRAAGGRAQIQIGRSARRPLTPPRCRCEPPGACCRRRRRTPRAPARGGGGRQAQARVAVERRPREQQRAFSLFALDPSARAGLLG